jgi:hypothetical protein
MRMLGPAKELRHCPAGMDLGQVRKGVGIGRCVSVRWASLAHLVALEEFSSDFLLTHFNCYYSSASVDHSSHVFTGGEVCFAENYFG